jgi:hypothetical protein
MRDQSPVMDLLQHGVPLRLLFDLAGFGDSAAEIYATELTEASLPDVPLPSALVGVAS